MTQSRHVCQYRVMPDRQADEEPKEDEAGGAPEYLSNSQAPPVAVTSTEKRMGPASGHPPAAGSEPRAAPAGSILPFRQGNRNGFGHASLFASTFYPSIFSISSARSHIDTFNLFAKPIASEYPQEFKA